MRNLLRVRNARIYLLGDTISVLGDSALWLAMAIWVKELTGSSAWAGLVFFCFALGNLFSPLGGVLADRFPRRPLLICVNLLTAAMVLLLLLVHGRGWMWLIFVVMFGYGVAGSVASPAATALLPAIVPADLLAEANGVQQTLREGLRLFTPLVGAGLFAWVGGGAVAIMDAATFLAAVAALAALRLNQPATDPDAVGAEGTGQVAPGQAATPAATTAADSIAGANGNSGGFQFLAGEPVLRSITIALALMLLVIGFSESATFSVVTTGLHHSASFVGVLMTTQGVGAIVGGLTAARLLKRTSESLLIVGALGCLIVGMLLLAVPDLGAALAGIAIAGLVPPWVIVAAMTALQTRTPPALLGRVSGVFQLSLGLPQIASVGVGAALISVVNYRLLLVVIAVVSALAAGYLMSVPETWHRARGVPAVTPVMTPDSAIADKSEGPDTAGTPVTAGTEVLAKTPSPETT